MRSSGFTYIEQLLIGALIVILGSLSGVYYSRFLLQGAVLNTADQLVSQLRKAQNYALTGKADSSWGVKQESGALVLFATRSAQFDETFTLNPNVELSGFSQIVFQKVTGLPTATPTIAITGGGNSASVTINSWGVVNR